MSALNVFLTPTEAHMFTDGALYEQETAIVRGIGPKTIILPQYNAVIAATGLYWVSTLLVAAMSGLRYGSFDELADGLSDLMKKTIEKGASLPGMPSSWGKFEVAVAGWSEKTDAPAAFYLRGYADGQDDAFVTYPATRFYSPDLSALAQRMDNRFLKYRFDPAAPEETGLELMELQRSIRFTFKDGSDRREYYAVGGFCQHSTVTKNSITTKVLKRWSDKIDERISMPFKQASAGGFM